MIEQSLVEIFSLRVQSFPVDSHDAIKLCSG